MSNWLLAVAMIVSSKPAPNCSTYACEVRVSLTAKVVGTNNTKILENNIKKVKPVAHV